MRNTITQTVTTTTVSHFLTADRSAGWDSGLKLAKSLPHALQTDTARLVAASLLALPNNAQRKAAIEALFYSL